MRYAAYGKVDGNGFLEHAPKRGWCYLRLGQARGFTFAEIEVGLPSLAEIAPAAGAAMLQLVTRAFARYFELAQ